MSSDSRDMRDKFLQNAAHFIWDEYNRDKNWQKHHVRFTECEEIFFNQPVVVAGRSQGLLNELRWYAFGESRLGRKLFIVFTIRNQGIRIISARDMSRKERRMYERF